MTVLRLTVAAIVISSVGGSVTAAYFAGFFIGLRAAHAATRVVVPNNPLPRPIDPMGIEEVWATTLGSD